jgi:RNA polymerase-binding transcription factor DksA
MDTKEFETALSQEKQSIENTLSSLSKKDPNNPNNWEANYPDLNVYSADKNDMADEVEEFDNALGVNSVLEEKLRDINDALDRIHAGTYGKCEKEKEMIDIDRLRANPAARNCVEHS